MHLSWIQVLILDGSHPSVMMPWIVEILTCETINLHIITYNFSDYMTLECNSHLQIVMNSEMWFENEAASMQTQYYCDITPDKALHEKLA